MKSELGRHGGPGHGKGRREMTKAFNIHYTLTGSHTPVHPEGVEATKGLLIGLALSQVLWIGIALLVF